MNQYHYKVRDLIKHLSKCHPETEVTIVALDKDDQIIRHYPITVIVTKKDSQGRKCIAVGN